MRGVLLDNREAEGARLCKEMLHVLLVAGDQYGRRCVHAERKGGDWVDAGDGSAIVSETSREGRGQ